MEPNDVANQTDVATVPPSGTPQAPAKAPTDITASVVEAPRHLKDIEKLFYAMGKNRSSDLHLKGGLRPIMRISTVLHEVGQKVLTHDEVKRMGYEIISEKQKASFEEGKGLDFAYSIEDGSRFRINMFYDRGFVAIAARRVNPNIPNFDQLHLPPTIRKIAQVTQGLVILAGPTGQGKSTTLASIIQWVNENRRVHIITIEDPVEYLFRDAKSFVNQREIGIDVEDWHMALKHVVRQNPDVILVGEMRDHISFDAALMAAETGHLVFGTIHSSSAGQIIGRILDLFQPERHDQIRMLLAFNLRAIVCQKLLPSCKEGVRMVPSVEILIVNPTVTKLIMNKEDRKIQDVIRGGEEEGMQDFNQSLVKLIKAGLVTKKAALQFSPNPEQLKMNLQGIYLGEDHKIIG